ncbi:MAG: T9SS type A sorting domain-containing protein [Bacteroidales bacterium]|nr:T9SS type A sorting domain-containing protein [Bacteroidales bacterium]
MIKILQVIGLFLFGLVLTTKAQDKQPEALPDYYNVAAGFENTFNPMVNDIVDEGNTARIFLVYDSPNSHFSFNDSCIFYTAEISFSGLDSIRYRIKDNQNGLMSEIAKIYINVINESRDTININNISALINPFGCLFWDYYESNHYEFPKGSGLNTIFSLALNIAGIDTQQNPYLSGILQRQFGADFFPGPVSSGEYYNLSYDTTWSKVWKLNKQEILTHISSWNQEGYVVPRIIARWPGNGDPSKGQALMMAPYYDKNENGLYDPENGDYPIIRGDQAVYFIYNDIRSPHTDFYGNGLSAEIHCMVYAFDLPDNPALNNTVFINYLITNRSNMTYSNVNFSLFADTDNGASQDDFVGCDTLLNAAISFNGKVPDSGGGGVVYGDHPPAQTIMLLNRDMSSFIVNGNVTGYQWLSRPYTSGELINYLSALWNDGSPIIGNGCGHNSCAAGNTVNYAFPGDPKDVDSWSMLQSPIGMNDYSYFMNIAPVQDFHPGETVCIDIALTSAIDENGDHLDSYTLVKQYAETVKTFYDANFPASCFDVAPAVDEKMVRNNDLVHAFPNPTDGILWINMNAIQATAEYQVLDLTGRIRSSGFIEGGQTSINMSSVESGMYILRIINNELNASVKIVKN